MGKPRMHSGDGDREGEVPQSCEMWQVRSHLCYHLPSHPNWNPGTNSRLFHFLQSLLDPSTALLLLCPQLSSNAHQVTPHSTAAPFLQACSPPPVLYMSPRVSLLKCTSICVTPCLTPSMNARTSRIGHKPTVRALSNFCPLHQHHTTRQKLNSN